MHYLVKGCTQPDDAVLDEFWQEAQNSIGADLPETYQVRWIGGDEDSTRHILEHIRTGQKTGTVTLPWVIKNTGQPTPLIGDTIILINFDGSPALIVQITKIEEVAYGSITTEHTGLDGPRVRELDVWKPLHIQYFDMMLAPYDLRVTDETPILFETFRLLYPQQETP